MKNSFEVGSTVFKQFRVLYQPRLVKKWEENRKKHTYAISATTGGTNKYSYIGRRLLESIYDALSCGNRGRYKGYNNISIRNSTDQKLGKEGSLLRSY